MYCYVAVIMDSDGFRLIDSNGRMVIKVESKRLDSLIGYDERIKGS